MDTKSKTLYISKDGRRKSMEKEKHIFVDIIGNLIITGVFLAICYYLFHYQPVMYIKFISEDGCSEYLTFLFYMTAFLILLWAFIKKGQTFWKPGYILLALIVLLIAMEEISWGQRIFGMTPPDFFKAMNRQGELNLHNLIDLSRYYHLITIIFLLVGVMSPIMTLCSTRLLNCCNRFGIPVISIRHWPLFCLPIILYHYGETRLNLFPKGEFIEVFIAIAITVMVKDLVFRSEREKGDETSILSTIKILAIIMICMVPIVLFSQKELNYKNRMYWFGTMIYPSRNMYHQAEAIFDYIHHRPSLQNQSYFYYHGLILLKQGRKENAKNMFYKAIEKVDLKIAEDPDNPNGYREKGQIFHAIGRNNEAEWYYLKAVDLDCQNLTVATSPKRVAIYRRSLGKTLYAMGQHEEALEQIKCATDNAPSKKFYSRTLRWVNWKKVRKKWIIPSEIKRIDFDFRGIACGKNTQYDKSACIKAD